MRVLMLTQKIDPTDPLLAFTMGWVEALAARVEHLHVLCLEQQPAMLPDNVTVWSMGKERGNNRQQEIRAFYRALNRVMREVDVVFCHMIPRYALLAAPYAIAFHKPMLLWYVHRHVNAELRFAIAACKTIATAVPDSFPLPTNKLRVLGHGIDTTYFAPDPTCPREEPPLIIQVARLMPIKRQDCLLRSLATDKLNGVNVALVGDVPRGQDRGYLDGLKALAADLGITNRVLFTGSLQIDAVRDLYRRASVAVNLSPPGLFDKAALESMLTGTPTVVSNPAFDPLLGEYTSRLHILAPEDTESLAAGLAALLESNASERQAMTYSIRERVIAGHSLNGLMDRLVALMELSR
ncbi:MAG: glycosyltransferase family 4 protein [Chloroflexota bacterium]